MSDSESDKSVFIYHPNKGAALFFAAEFLISGIWHLWQCYRYRCFKLMGLHLFCAPMLAAGFAMRSYGAWNYSPEIRTNINVYIASTCLIYMAPPLLELANYHVLGRILYYVPYFSPLHPGRVLTTFGILSGLVETMNAIGVAYIANPDVKDSSRKIGHGLMKASLIIQIVVIGLFCLLAFDFQRRCKKAGIRSRKISGPMLTMYISMGLIAVRCVYRTVEHFGFSAMELSAGSKMDFEELSPIIRYEWFFYVFEAALMLINTWMWNLRHPRRYLPENYNVYLAQDGVTEIKGPGWKDNRPFLMTVIDPFNWMGSKEDKQPPYWENNGFDFPGTSTGVELPGNQRSFPAKRISDDQQQELLRPREEEIGLGDRPVH